MIYKPYSWEQRKLNELADISTGYPFDSEEFQENGRYLVITNGNIQDDFSEVVSTVGNRIDLNNRRYLTQFILNVGDILVTMDGTVGRTAKVAHNEQILAQRVGRLISNIDNEYLYQSLNTGDFSNSMIETSHGGTIKHISLKEIGNYCFFVSPNKAEQKTIGLILKNIDTLITLHQREQSQVLAKP